MLCASITPSAPADIFSSDFQSADCVEVRLDYLSNPQQSSELSWLRLGIPVIATCRRVDRGGRFKGTLEEERAILAGAVRRGAAFIDIDYRDAQAVRDARVIGSYHNFEETPADLRTHLEAACANPAVEIAKMATLVRSWSDNRRLLDLLAQPWPKPVIVAGMGEMGQITRIIGPSRGSYLTYSTVQAPSSEADDADRLTSDDLIRRYRYHRIQRTTKLFGVIGNPVSHSRGYIMHNMAFDEAEVNFAYLKLLVTDVREFFENAAAIGIYGFSVTMPHKTAVIPYLLEMTPAAREVGAVNTVSNVGGSWVGDNTDVHGARAALASVHFDPRDKRVVILGAGGAAKAGAVAVKGAGSLVVLPRAEVKNSRDYPCDLLINATPIGMLPDVDATPVEGAIAANVVFDMVYTPPMTRLLRLASEQGKTVIPGTTMFYAQAARQFEIWTGRCAPAAVYHPESSA